MAVHNTQESPFDMKWTVDFAEQQRALRWENRRRKISSHLLLGGALVLVLLITALLGPWLAIAPPDLVRPALRLQPPSLSAPFGTDTFGRDLYSRVVSGARIAVGMSFYGVLLSALPGTLLGLLAGYRRGWLETCLSRLMDAWLSLPGMLLAIVLVARMGPSILTLVLALGITGVPTYYRLVRNATLSLRKAGYIEAVQALGATEARILFRHLLPNLASPVIVLTTLRLGSVLLAGAGLSFLGLGAQPPTAEWGALLASGRDAMETAWWLAVFPGLAITLSVMGFNLLGDGLRDLLSLAAR